MAQTNDGETIRDSNPTVIASTYPDLPNTWSRRGRLAIFAVGFLSLLTAIFFALSYELKAKAIGHGDILSFSGSALGAILAVAGALYVERWRADRTVTGDRRLLADSLSAIAATFSNRTVKLNPNYLLTGLDGMDQILINHTNLCADGIDLLTEARAAIAIKDFKTLELLRRTRNVLQSAYNNFSYLRQEFPNRQA